MAKDPREAFLADIGNQAARQRKEQKSDDIIKYIRTNWKLFCSRRSEMEQHMRGLGTIYPYSVDALCDQLGLPDNVFFKKYKVTDTSIALLRFPKSKIFDDFQACCVQVPSAEALLFAVAGNSTIIVTNMQTSYFEGQMHLFFKSLGALPDIHIFAPENAPERIPTLFDKTD